MTILEDLLKQFELEIKEKLSETDFKDLDKKKKIKFLFKDKLGNFYNSKEIVNLLYWKTFFQKKPFSWQFSIPNLTWDGKIISQIDTIIDSVEILESYTILSSLDFEKANLLNASNAVENWLKERIIDFKYTRQTLQVPIKDGKCEIIVPISPNQPGELSFKNVKNLRVDGALVSYKDNAVHFSFDSDSLLDNFNKLNSFLIKYGIKWNLDILVQNLLSSSFFNGELSKAIISVLFENTDNNIVCNFFELLGKIKQIVDSTNPSSIKDLITNLKENNIYIPGNADTQEIILSSIISNFGEKFKINKLITKVNLLHNILPWFSTKKQAKDTFDRWLSLQYNFAPSKPCITFMDSRGFVYTKDEILDLLCCFNIPEWKDTYNIRSSKIQNINYDDKYNELTINLDKLIPLTAIKEASDFLKKYEDKIKNQSTHENFVSSLKTSIHSAFLEKQEEIKNKNPSILIKDSAGNFYSINELSAFYRHKILKESNNIYFVQFKDVYYDDQYNEIIASIDEYIDVFNFLDIIKDQKFSLSEQKENNALLRRSIKEKFADLPPKELDALTNVINKIFDVNDQILSLTRSKDFSNKLNETIAVLKSTCSKFLEFLEKEASFDEVSEILSLIEESSFIFSFSNDPQFKTFIEQLTNIKDKKSKDKSFNSSEYNIEKLNKFNIMLNDLSNDIKKISDSDTEKNKNTISNLNDDEAYISKILDEILDDMIAKKKNDISTQTESKIKPKSSSQDSSKIIENKTSDESLSEPEKAAVRIGARKISKATHNILLDLFKSQGISKNSTKSIQELLASNYGKAFLSYISGLSLNKITDNNKINLLADELKVEGMSSGLESLLDGLLDIKTNKQNSKVRIADTQQNIIEEENVEEEERWNTTVLATE